MNCCSFFTVTNIITCKVKVKDYVLFFRDFDKNKGQIVSFLVSREMVR